MFSNAWEPGDYYGGDDCVTVGSSNSWMRADLSTTRTVRTFYVMGSQRWNKWGDLVGVKVYISSN